MRGPAQQVKLPPRPTSAAEARKFMARALRGADRRTQEIGILLASELVTNALLYAQGRITLSVADHGDVFRVTVHDASEQEPRPRNVGVDATSGRGLVLVEQLATSWGVEAADDGGKDVWFELPRPE